jgi:hypothetical protein
MTAIMAPHGGPTTAYAPIRCDLFSPPPAGIVNLLGIGKDSSQKRTHLCMREKSSRSHADRLQN